MSAFMDANALQKASDAILGGDERMLNWCYATTKSTSGLPTLAFDPVRDAENLPGCFAQVWICNLDCVLEETWLAMVRATRGKREIRKQRTENDFFLYQF